MNTSLDPASGASQETGSDGFDILDACHRQTVFTLGKLAALVSRLGTVGSDPQTRELATEILAHFSITAREHHEDEERHVFPRLLNSDDPDTVQAVLRLRQDHRWLEEDWRTLSPQIEAVAWGHVGFDCDILREGAAVFTALSHEHIALEQSVVYPQARARCSPGDGSKMTLEITARRGLRVERGAGTGDAIQLARGSA